MRRPRSPRSSTSSSATSTSTTPSSAIRRMGEPVPELQFSGHPAAPGLFAGSVFVLTAPTGRREASGDPASEETALLAAVTTALAELAALVEKTSGDAADM